jgi:hypothetical protein
VKFYESTKGCVADSEPAEAGRYEVGAESPLFGT